MPPGIRGVRTFYGRRLRKDVLHSVIVEPGLDVDKLAAAGLERDRISGGRQGDVLPTGEEGMAPVFLAPFSRSGVYVRSPDDLPPGISSVSVQKETAPVCVEKNPCTFLQISTGCRTEPYTTRLRGTVSAICAACNIRFQGARFFPGAPPPCLSSCQIRPYSMKLPVHGPGCSSATLGRGHSAHSSHPHDSQWLRVPRP